MNNLDQLRAANALDALKKYPQLQKKKQHDDQDAQGGDQLTGFPALIVNNGLLATIAFSQTKGRDSDHVCICHAIAEHLNARRLLDAAGDAQFMADELARGDSTKLRLCTAEALAYLNYLRRFAKAEA